MLTESPRRLTVFGKSLDKPRRILALPSTDGTPPGLFRKPIANRNTRKKPSTPWRTVPQACSADGSGHGGLSGTITSHG